MEETIKKIKKFIKDRDWDKFHSGSNLSKSIAIEASELLEVFQWSDETDKIDDLKDELADVLIYSIMLAEKYNLEIEEIILDKLKKNEVKYPIDMVKGKSKKYNEY